MGHSFYILTINFYCLNLADNIVIYMSFIIIYSQIEPNQFIILLDVNIICFANNKLLFFFCRKLAKFSLVLIPLFGVLYIVTSAYPTGVDVKADMIYLYCEMFYNSFQVITLVRSRVGPIKTEIKT